MGKIDREGILADWIDRYQNLILSVCFHMTGDYFASQDLTQETFLAAFLHMAGFDGKNEKAWLCRIAANKCTDYLRQAGRRMIPTEDASMDAFHSPAGRPEQETLEAAVREELREKCRSLKPPYDEIAYQYFYLEKKPEEIADEQGKNKKTVETQIYRAREKLRHLYGQDKAAGKRENPGKDREERSGRMDENKTGYLTDEELNRLIDHVEQHEMLRAPSYLKAETMERLERALELQSRPVLPRLPKTRNEKTRELFLYSLKVGAAAAAAIVMLFSVPVKEFEDLGRKTWNRREQTERIADTITRGLGEKTEELSRGLEAVSEWLIPGK